MKAVALEKFGLGSVQFGMPYGIANDQGQTPPAEVSRILTFAKAQGLSLVDTAEAYGTSLDVLGSLLERDTKTKIVSKLTTKKDVTPAEIRNQLERMFLRLKKTSLYAVLAHDGSAFCNSLGDSLYDVLSEFKKEGRIEKIGVSVYRPSQLESILSTREIDIVQLPCNLLDQRFLQSGMLTLLSSRGITVHIRSLFLQGALLAKPEKLSARHPVLASVVEKTQTELATQGLSPLAGCVAFGMSLPEVEVCILGVDSLSQLEEIAQTSARRRDSNLDFSTFACSDETLLDPSLWPPV